MCALYSVLLFGLRVSGAFEILSLPAKALRHSYATANVAVAFEPNPEDAGLWRHLITRGLNKI